MLNKLQSALIFKVISHISVWKTNERRKGGKIHFWKSEDFRRKDFFLWFHDVISAAAACQFLQFCCSFNPSQLGSFEESTVD